jgi:tetrahydrodipicolinate N-succinyltransferase
MIPTTESDSGVDIGAGVEVGSGAAVGEGAAVGAGTAVAVAVGIGVLVGGTGVTVGSGSLPHATPSAIKMNKLDTKNTALTRLSLSPNIRTLGYRVWAVAV